MRLEKPGHKLCWPQEGVARPWHNDCVIAIPAELSPTSRWYETWKNWWWACTGTGNLQSPQSAHATAYAPEVLEVVTIAKAVVVTAATATVITVVVTTVTAIAVTAASHVHPTIGSWRASWLFACDRVTWRGIQDWTFLTSGQSARQCTGCVPLRRASCWLEVASRCSKSYCWVRWPQDS